MERSQDSITNTSSAAHEKAVSSEEATGSKPEIETVSSRRVEQLSLFLKRQQEVVYKQQNISKIFPATVEKIASQSWEQIHPSITTAIEVRSHDHHGKYDRLLKEWDVTSKLSNLDRQQLNLSNTSPAWRPTGIPEEDSQIAESAEASQTLHEFESKITQAEKLSSDLEHQLREKETELDKLDHEIQTLLNSLQQKTESYPLTSPSS